MPGSTIPLSPFLAAIYADKWVHIGLFAILCFLFFLPLLKYRFYHSLAEGWFWMIVLTGIIYGGLMELVQKYWVINRSFDVWDIVADGVGCLLAYLFCRTAWFGKWLKKNWSR